MLAACVKEKSRIQISEKLGFFPHSKKYKSSGSGFVSLVKVTPINRGRSKEIYFRFLVWILEDVFFKIKVFC